MAAGFKGAVYPVNPNADTLLKLKCYPAVNALPEIPELVVIADETPDTTQFGFGEEASGRITLRLPESLKAGVEAAADREGISTNAWVVRSIARTLEQRPARKSRNRMQGYAQG